MPTKKTTTREAIDLKEFETKIPAPFNVSPFAEVPVSKNYTARIFADTEDNQDPNHPKQGWRVVVRHNISGLPPRDTHRYGRYAGESFHARPLDVKLMLETWVTELAPKKVTRTVTHEETDD